MLEKGPPTPAGYDKLSAIVGARRELAIYRQYSALNAKNLHYLQAELFHLQEELADLEAEDKASGDPDKALFPRSVWHLKRSLRNTGQDLQWRKVLKIRELLKEYNTAILQQAEINKLERPRESSIKLLKEWLEHPDGGYFFPYGRERRIWDFEDKDDFVALSTLSGRYGDADRFTHWLDATVYPWCHRHGADRVKEPKTDKHGNKYWDYDERLLVAIANAFSTLIASLMPTIAIFVLYFVKSTLARLGVILCFSALFSLALSLVAKAKKIETFAATTAFAAVQVVFVGGFNGHSSI